ncbi:glycoside hydrolase family 13 protein [Bacteroidales bacterium OttesenSCG-928-A17]|nr:glycoside hydrolase family 13 protein [Bacteroidales bacterium OttesenSCG-928-A17]
MKKTIVLLTVLIHLSAFVHAVEIKRVEPTFWWTGMKQTELQILFYGDKIGETTLEFNYPGVILKEIVQVENPNYLFVYLDITPDTKPGKIDFTFKKGKKKKVLGYELKPRASSVGAQGFDSSDVLYLIMPDRFANGDTSNDEWNDVLVKREDPFGRHGGDLEGINKNLDYIKELGVTAIWLNPVLENNMPRGSYHGYAITDFYKVDPRFGSNEDYCRFIENTHNKGLKIVMDMIYNHCGSQHWWINDFPTSDWLNHQDGFVPTSHNLYAVMDPHAPPSEVDGMTKGWFVREMPDLNQKNRLLADYLIQNSIWWIEYARIDGIRHDTHPYADFDFLARWCKRIETEYPNFNIVGESWYIYSSPLAWWQKGANLNNKETNLKTTMDFAFMDACDRAFNRDANERNPLRMIYEVIAQDFLYSDCNNLLVFLDNHDTSRFTKEKENNLDKFKQAIALLLTTRGIPQLYYGTEILMFGEKKDGDGNLRKDFPGGWPGDPVDAFTKAGRTDMQNEAWDYMQKLLQWRKTKDAVINGDLIHYAPMWNNECYVYARIGEKDRVLVILNGSDEDKILHPYTYRDVISGYTSGTDVVTGKRVSFRNEFVVPARGVFVLEMIK